MNLIFDTHAHYDDEAFDADREALLSSMPENGVGLIVDPGCDLDTSRRAVEIAEQYPHVYSAVGWHPENCAPYTRESLDTLRAWAKNPKVVAIGEIGLDYYWEQNPPREFQQEVFRDQLALAQELGLPVIVHDRDAHADCLAIVKEFPQVRGVFHCFASCSGLTSITLPKLRHHCGRLLLRLLLGLNRSSCEPRNAACNRILHLWRL